MGEAWPNRGKTTSAAQSAPLCCLACQNGQEGETLSYVNTCVGHWYHVFPVITRSLQHRFCDDSCGSSSFPTEQPHERESAFRKQYRYCDSKLGLSIRCRAHRLHFTRIVETGRPSLVCIVCHHVKLIARPVVLPCSFLNIVAVQPSFNYVEWACQLRDEK